MGAASKKKLEQISVCKILFARDLCVDTDFVTLCIYWPTNWLLLRKHLFTSRRRLFDSFNRDGDCCLDFCICYRGLRSSTMARAKEIPCFVQFYYLSGLARSPILDLT